MGNTTSAPLQAALEAQARRNELLISWGGSSVFAVAMVMVGVLWSFTPADSVFHRVTSHYHLLTALGMIGWYAVAIVLLRRGVGMRFFMWVTPILEASYPAVVMATELHFEKPGFIAFTTLGPILYAVPFTFGVLRLRWQVPLLCGAIAAMEFGVLVALGIAPHLQSSGVDPTLREVIFFWARPATLLLIGVTGALATLQIRRTVGAVHGEVRSQELFGKYRLGEPIAAGGMGEVVRATYCPEGGFEKPVAIKRMHPHLASDERFLTAFRHEAELCSRLTHPNVVQVLDFGQEGGSYFLAMEFVEGTTLQAVLSACRARGQPMPPALVAEVGRRIAAALTFAHVDARDGRGQRLHVIHRDLSPNNVLLSWTGQVKVTDFGVAKALGDKDVTVTESVAGKLTYMAPEQVLAQPLDERCDLFALGIILWEALTNERLFAADSDAAIVARVVSLPIPPPSMKRPELADTGWDPLLARALERVPSARIRSASEVAAALEPLAQGASADGLAAFVRETCQRPVNDVLPTTNSLVATSATTTEATATARERP